MIDVRMFTVGPVQENCFIVRAKDSDRAVIVDPGEEADRLIGALDAIGIKTVEAILVTHTHFDHVGAVAPLAASDRGTGVLPRAGNQRARQHHGLRAMAGVRAVREL